MDFIFATCPANLLGWGCAFWPIFLPCIVAIVVVILWWLLGGAKLTNRQNNQKDYSLVFIFGSIILIGIVGFWIYFANKIYN